MEKKSFQKIVQMESRLSQNFYQLFDNQQTANKQRKSSACFEEEWSMNNDTEVPQCEASKISNRTRIIRQDQILKMKKSLNGKIVSKIVSFPNNLQSAILPRPKQDKFLSLKIRSPSPLEKLKECLFEGKSLKSELKRTHIRRKSCHGQIFGVDSKKYKKYDNLLIDVIINEHNNQQLKQLKQRQQRLSISRYFDNLQNKQSKRPSIDKGQMGSLINNNSSESNQPQSSKKQIQLQELPTEKLSIVQNYNDKNFQKTNINEKTNIQQHNQQQFNFQQQEECELDFKNQRKLLFTCGFLTHSSIPANNFKNDNYIQKINNLINGTLNKFKAKKNKTKINNEEFIKNQYKIPQNNKTVNSYIIQILPEIHQSINEDELKQVIGTPAQKIQNININQHNISHSNINEINNQFPAANISQTPKQVRLAKIDTIWNRNQQLMSLKQMIKADKQNNSKKEEHIKILMNKHYKSKSSIGNNFSLQSNETATSATSKQIHQGLKQVANYSVYQSPKGCYQISNQLDLKYLNKQFNIGKGKLQSEKQRSMHSSQEYLIDRKHKNINSQNFSKEIRIRTLTNREFK